MSVGARTASIAVGQCCCHSSPTCISANAPLISFSGDCTYEGMGAGRIGDVVLNGCGHTGIISSGSSQVLINGIPGAWIGSVTIGCVRGVIVNGAPTVQIGA